MFMSMNFIVKGSFGVRGVGCGRGGHDHDAAFIVFVLELDQDTRRVRTSPGRDYKWAECQIR